MRAGNLTFTNCQIMQQARHGTARQMHGMALEYKGNLIRFPNRRAQAKNALFEAKLCCERFATERG